MLSYHEAHQVQQHHRVSRFYAEVLSLHVYVCTHDSQLLNQLFPCTFLMIDLPWVWSRAGTCIVCAFVSSIAPPTTVWDKVGICHHTVNIASPLGMFL